MGGIGNWDCSSNYDIGDGGLVNKITLNFVVSIIWLRDLWSESWSKGQCVYHNSQLLICIQKMLTELASKFVEYKSLFWKRGQRRLPYQTEKQGILLEWMIQKNNCGSAAAAVDGCFLTGIIMGMKLCGRGDLVVNIFSRR
jgi:hypothetical protein